MGLPARYWGNAPEILTERYNNNVSSRGASVEQKAQTAMAGFESPGAKYTLLKNGIDGNL